MKDDFKGAIITLLFIVIITFLLYRIILINSFNYNEVCSDSFGNGYFFGESNRNVITCLKLNYNSIEKRYISLIELKKECPIPPYFDFSKWNRNCKIELKELVKNS